MDTNIIRRDAILKLRKEGNSYREISKKLNCNLSLVSYYCGKCDIEKQNMREESKSEYEGIVCDLVSKLDNINQVCKALNKSQTNRNREHIQKIIDKYQLDTSHFLVNYNGIVKKKKIDDEEIFKSDSFFSSSLIKKRLLALYKEYVCESCGNTHWLDKPIPLQLHHKNGNNKDNSITNLQLLCPNCHALTDNYCGKNKKNVKYILKAKKCPQCGNSFYGENKYCSKKCEQEAWIQKWENKTNTRYDELRKNIIKYAKEKCSFKYIGLKMNVTDNAVRKWCKKIGLPYHTKDLKQYIINNDIK